MNENAIVRRVLASPTTGRCATAALVVRLLTASVFLSFGSAKFLDHATEVASFRTYGFPQPSAVVYAVGVLEVGAGLCLLLGLLVRLAAAALVGDMVGAIVTSGIQHGETISLTLAPAMLVGMAFLLWSGAGKRALDARLLAAMSSGGGRAQGPRSPMGTTTPSSRA